jgi:hypothetical protein
MSDEQLKIGIPISLAQPDDFLKVKETLSRIGVASWKEHKLYQSCHILHKRGKYYICHFKELFMLDGKTSNITPEDYQRRNLIATLLRDWGLLKVLDEAMITDVASMSSVKVLSFSEKDKWTLITKYNIGVKR